jgi:Mrp family chromosome partitioning ATPase
MKVTAISEEYSPDLLPAMRLPKARIRSCLSRLIAEIFERSEDDSKAGVMLTSPTRQAGVSFICSSMAAELALQGMKVLLVDARALLSVRSLSIQGVVSLCRRVGAPQLWVLGAEEVSKASRVFKGETVGSIEALLRGLEREFPYLLIDAPALTTGSDANVLATHVHGTVLVARNGQTGKAQLQKAQTGLTAFGGRVIGSVFNAH